jgi:hypothetical protein
MLFRAEQTLLEPRPATAPGQDARQKRATPAVQAGSRKKERPAGHLTRACASPGVMEDTNSRYQRVPSLGCPSRPGSLILAPGGGPGVMLSRRSLIQLSLPRRSPDKACESLSTARMRVQIVSDLPARMDERVAFARQPGAW